MAIFCQPSNKVGEKANFNVEKMTTRYYFKERKQPQILHKPVNEQHTHKYIYNKKKLE